MRRTYNCATMNLSSLTAISPLDGRYAAKLSALRPIMSEYGYMHRRVQVEVTWFIALSDAGFAEFPALSAESRDYLHALVANFSEADADAHSDANTDVDPDRVEQTISKIVRDLENLGENEVTTETIGETVMAHLRDLDDVAYVRFASVYRNFREAKDFEQALAELAGEEDQARPAPARK